MTLTQTESKSEAGGPGPGRDRPKWVRFIDSDRVAAEAVAVAGG